MSQELLEGLNDIQQQAVQHKDGPMLVLAGAGSGKTRVLTHRVAWLIDQGVVPTSILAITFTNKAAGEMKERIQTILRSRTDGGMPIIGTFHAMCVRILRRHSQHIGIPNNFSIYDTTDTNALVKQVMKKMDISTKKVNPSAVRSTISNAKNEMVGAGEYGNYTKGYFYDMVGKIYPEYQKLLKENQALDFDDLLLYTYELISQVDEVREYYHREWQYIMVDEYQDTNKVQYLLTKLLAEHNRNIGVVGDAAQSIYAFRGADLRNVNQFLEDYPEAEVYNLEQNYRSTRKILKAATAIIKPNEKSHPVLTLWTDNDEGEHLTVFEAGNAKDEIDYVIAQIEQGTLDGKKFEDFSVLYRTNAQSRTVEEGLIRAGIPYTMIGGVKFYERKEIKDLISYLRYIQNSQDSVSYERIVNTPPRGIGAVTFEQGGPALDRFHEMMDRFREKAQTLNVSELLDHVLETTKYRDYILDGSEEGIARWENIQELRNVAEEYADEGPVTSLSSFLESVALLEQTDITTNEASGVNVGEGTGNDRVILMTLHAAKGLEFPTVFLVGMEEGVFPHSRSLDDDFQIEEERRLCYVGITRAKEKLYLTYARNRMTYGSFNVNMPSRFLNDLPQDLLEWERSPQVIKSSWDQIDDDGYGGGNDPLNQWDW